MKDLVSQGSKMGRSRAGRSVWIPGSLPMAETPTLPVAAPNRRSLSLLPFTGTARAKQPAGDGIRMQLPWK